jgi:membrane protease YdiL (CAAX protease family)
MSTPPGPGFGLLLTLFSLPLALWLLFRLRRAGVSNLRRRRSIPWTLAAGSVASVVAFGSTALTFGFIFGKGFGDGFGDGYMRALPLLGVEFVLSLLFVGMAVAVTPRS